MTAKRITNHHQKCWLSSICSLLSQDVNKSGKSFQMRKIRFFSLLAHKNLIQYERLDRAVAQSIIVLIWQIRKIFDVGPSDGPYVPESQGSWHPELICRMDWWVITIGCQGLIGCWKFKIICGEFFYTMPSWAAGLFITSEYLLGDANVMQYALLSITITGPWLLRSHYRVSCHNVIVFHLMHATEPWWIKQQLLWNVL